jgi:SAM-dependent methyltransferase
MPPRIERRFRSRTGGTSWKQFFQRLTHPAWLGSLRRTTPISDRWGYDRGTPIDRYYIGRFLETHRQDIHGHVLEVKDCNYTDRYGINVTRSDILDIDPANPHATVVADLAAADPIPANSFDCFILTQTLQFVTDLRAAIAHIHRILRPGGVLLCTVPGLSRVERAYATTDYWRFTPAACSLLFNSEFGAEQVSVCGYGNVLTAIAFLTGMASEELSKRELTMQAEHFPVMIAIRAVKRA